jgi:hypothetical protein
VFLVLVLELVLVLVLVLVLALALALVLVLVLLPRGLVLGKLLALPLLKHQPPLRQRLPALLSRPLWQVTADPIRSLPWPTLPQDLQQTLLLLMWLRLLHLKCRNQQSSKGQRRSCLLGGCHKFSNQACRQERASSSSSSSSRSGHPSLRLNQPLCRSGPKKRKEAAT